MTSDATIRFNIRLSPKEHEAFELMECQLAFSHRGTLLDAAVSFLMQLFAIRKCGGEVQVVTPTAGKLGFKSRLMPLISAKRERASSKSGNSRTVTLEFAVASATAKAVNDLVESELVMTQSDGYRIAISHYWEAMGQVKKGACLIATYGDGRKTLLMPGQMTTVECEPARFSKILGLESTAANIQTPTPDGFTEPAKLLKWVRERDLLLSQEVAPREIVDRILAISTAAIDVIKQDNLKPSQRITDRIEPFCTLQPLDLPFIWASPVALGSRDVILEGAVDKTVRFSVANYFKSLGRPEGEIAKTLSQHEPASLQDFLRPRYGSSRVLGAN